MEDPRKAKTLGEACQNPDGTYNGIRLMSWLSGLPMAEVEKIANEAVQRTKEKRNGNR